MTELTEQKMIAQDITVYQCDWCLPTGAATTGDATASGWSTVTIHIPGFDDLAKHACPGCASAAMNAFSSLTTRQP